MSKLSAEIEDMIEATDILSKQPIQECTAQIIAKISKVIEAAGLSIALNEVKEAIGRGDINRSMELARLAQAKLQTLLSILNTSPPPPIPPPSRATLYLPIPPNSPK